MKAFLLTIRSCSDDGEKKNEVGLSGNRRLSATGFMPLNDSAEKFRTPGLTARMILPARGAIDGVTPPISGLADFTEGNARASSHPGRKGWHDNLLNWRLCTTCLELFVLQPPKTFTPSNSNKTYPPA